MTFEAVARGVVGLKTSGCGMLLFPRKVLSDVGEAIGVEIPGFMDKGESGDRGAAENEADGDKGTGGAALGGCTPMLFTSIEEDRVPAGEDGVCGSEGTRSNRTGDLSDPPPETPPPTVTTCASLLLLPILPNMPDPLFLLAPGGDDLSLSLSLSASMGREGSNEPRPLVLTADLFVIDAGRFEMDIDVRREKGGVDGCGGGSGEEGWECGCCSSRSLSLPRSRETDRLDPKPKSGLSTWVRGDGTIPFGGGPASPSSNAANPSSA